MREKHALSNSMAENSRFGEITPDLDHFSTLYLYIKPDLDDFSTIYVYITPDLDDFSTFIYI